MPRSFSNPSLIPLKTLPYLSLIHSISLPYFFPDPSLGSRLPTHSGKYNLANLQILFNLWNLKPCRLILSHCLSAFFSMHSSAYILLHAISCSPVCILLHTFFYMHSSACILLHAFSCSPVCILLHAFFNTHSYACIFLHAFFCMHSLA